MEEFEKENYKDDPRAGKRKDEKRKKKRERKKAWRKKK